MHTMKSHHPKSLVCVFLCLDVFRHPSGFNYIHNVQFGSRVVGGKICGILNIWMCFGKMSSAPPDQAALDKQLRRIEAETRAPFCPKWSWACVCSGRLTTAAQNPLESVKTHGSTLQSSTPPQCVYMASLRAALRFPQAPSEPWVTGQTSADPGQSPGASDHKHVDPTIALLKVSSDTRQLGQLPTVLMLTCDIVSPSSSDTYVADLKLWQYGHLVECKL